MPSENVQNPVVHSPDTVKNYFSHHNYFTKENIPSLLITFLCTFSAYDFIIF
jgi:hypothetical protein